MAGPHPRPPPPSQGPQIAFPRISPAASPGRKQRLKTATPGIADSEPHLHHGSQPSKSRAAGPAASSARRRRGRPLQYPEGATTEISIPSRPPEQNPNQNVGGENHDRRQHRRQPYPPKRDRPDRKHRQPAPRLPQNKNLHHYATGQSPVNPELHGVRPHTMSQESLFITSFPSSQEASMSAAARGRARPFEAPILRKLSQQET